MNVLYASGILFYSISPDRTMYFLLGKNNDNKWENFGGGCEISDRGDPINTASRETWEETLGCIYESEQIKNILKNRNVPYVISKTPSNKNYYMYILKIPYNFLYREKFLNTKNFLYKLEKIDQKFLEMKDIKWVSLDTLKHSIYNKKSIIRLRSIFETNLRENINDILKITNIE